MKINDFYQTFINVRNSLGNSISVQNELIDQLTDVLSGDISAMPNEITSMLSDGLTTVSFKTDNNKLIIKESIGSTITSDTTEEISELSIDEIRQDFILPGSGLSIMQVLQDVNDSEKLNYAIARINDQLLNYGKVATSYANSIIQNIKESDLGNVALSQLQEAILSTGDTDIDPYCWTNMVNGLYHPIAVKDNTTYHNLVLDENVHTIQRFVGTTILGVLSTIVQVVAAIISIALRAIGFILSLLGNALSWLINTTVPTHFNVNVKSVNRLLDKPTFFWSGSTPLNFHCPENGYAIVVDKPFSTSVMWRKKEGATDQLLCNEYLKMNIDPDGFQEFLLANCTVRHQLMAGGQYLEVRWVGDFNPIVDFDDMPDSCFMDQDRLIEVTSNDNGAAKCIAAALVYQWLRHAEYDDISGTQGFDIWYTESSNSNPSWVTLSNNVQAMMAEIVGHFLNKAYYDDNHPTFSEDYYSGASVLNSVINAFVNTDKTYGGMLDYYINIGTWSGISVSHLVKIFPYYEKADSMTIGFVDSYDNNAEWVGYETDRIMSAETVNFPSDRFISWPDYTSDALKNSIIIALGIMAATAAVVGVTAGYVKRRVNRWKFDSAAKLNEARENYLNSGSDVDYAILRRRMFSYNIKAKLFGWQTYDVTNGWFNDSGSDASDSISNVINNTNNTSTDVNEVIKLIR